MINYIGIDLGYKGGIACVNDEGMQWNSWDFPLAKYKTSNRSNLIYQMIKDFINEIRNTGDKNRITMSTPHFVNNVQTLIKMARMTEYISVFIKQYMMGTYKCVECIEEMHDTEARKLLSLPRKKTDCHKVLIEQFSYLSDCTPDELDAVMFAMAGRERHEKII